MLENIECLGHSTIKIKVKPIIYVDPFNIKDFYYDADIIFITHSHYDHFSQVDIEKIKKSNTKIVIPEDLYESVLNLHFLESNILTVRPNNSYKIENILFDTVPAYNNVKSFHPKENNWVGYIIEINKVKYYIAGDTDITKENKKVKCDIAFLPIGGTYTMDYKEAAILTNFIKPKLVIPIHYGSIVGSSSDAEEFIKLVDDGIESKIMF